MKLSRRAWLVGASTLGAAALAGERSYALGRTRLGGRVTLDVPWPLRAIDPHDARDGAAALFAHALFDPLYGLDAAGEPYPALAADPPRVEGGVTVVALREGLVTSHGRALDARDLEASIARARKGGAAVLLGELPPPKRHARDPLAVTFATKDEARVAWALASPLASLVPRGFSPTRPEGTGAMRATLRAGTLVLARNPGAARGASFLDEVVVREAPDLSASLRSFEAGRADMGWLGAGLHAPREGSVAFDAGPVAWVVLASGREAGEWGAPGVAQSLLDAVPAERLRHLGLGALPTAKGEAAWGGPPTDVLHAEDAPWLAEIARVLAGVLGRPGHELTARGLPAVELARRRAAGAFALLVDVVRPLGSLATTAAASLTATVDPRGAAALLEHPPRAAPASARAATRALRLGVVGELRVAGAAIPELRLATRAGGEGWDWGASSRAPRSP